MAEKKIKVKNVGSVGFHSELGVIAAGQVGLVTASEAQNHLTKLEPVVDEKAAAEKAAAEKAAAEKAAAEKAAAEKAAAEKAAAEKAAAEKAAAEKK
jgi:membrane protein involved in colicin uptake